MKIAFFKIEPWAKELVERSPVSSGNECVFIDSALNENNLPEQNDFDVISVFVDSAVTGEVIKHFPNLKLIATRSTGYDHIDVAACKEK